jgi:hypothetical protein
MIDAIHVAISLVTFSRLAGSIERLQDQVIGWPRATLLEQIAETRNSLLHLRRIVSGTRRAVFQLRHVVSPIIGEDMSPVLAGRARRPGDQSRNDCLRA